MFRALSTCLLCTLLLTAVATGQTLAIQVPAENQVYTLIDVAATPGFNSYLWTIERPDREESSQWRQTSPDCDQICFTGPPGKYRLSVIVTSAECKLLRATATTTIGGSAPDPTPEPLPSDLTAVVIVEESSSRTPQQAAVILSLPWRQFCKSKDLLVRLVDPDVTDQTGSVPSDLKPALQAAKKHGLPAVCFVGGDGSVLAVPLPESVEAMVALVKKYGGE